MRCRAAAAVLAVACVAAAPACTVHQAHTTRATAEIVTAGALALMIASIFATSLSPGHAALADIGITCVPISLLGAGVYIAADQRIPAGDDPPRAPTASRPVVSLTERANRRARELAGEAAAAARAADCDQVRSLEERIAQLDATVHEASLRYRRIRVCLGLPHEPEPEPRP